MVSDLQDFQTLYTLGRKAFAKATNVGSLRILLLPIASAHEKAHCTYLLGATLKVIVSYLLHSGRQISFSLAVLELQGLVL